MPTGKPASNGNAPDTPFRLKHRVFYGSVIGIVLFSLWAMFFTEQANTVINQVLGWISSSFGWFYFLAVIAYLVFVVIIGFSRFGNIKLGPDHSEPEFSLATWAAMLFATGIGIDLIFFCIVEPVTQFLVPPTGTGGDIAAARHAMELTYLHWGLSGWGVYTLIGVSLAYFSYRHGLPLTMRSALYPLFGKRINGAIGDAVDGSAVLGTVFGIATSLGIGIIQLNFGLKYMFGISEGLMTQSILAIMIVAFATMSAVSGVERGIRRLSELNMLMALALALFILVTGQTRFLLDAFVNNMGDYLQNFISLSFDTYAYDPPVDWLNAWTLFFWAWWIAWGPFVGMFLARISRGRTIRSFVAGSLILPFTFMAGWMSIMGNSAIELVMNGAIEFGQQAMQHPGSAIYLFLEHFPLSGTTTLLVTLLAIIFFVTSGDSGSLVLSNLTSDIRDPRKDAPGWMRILWAAIIGTVTIALLITDGLTALQSIVVIMGLPFAFVLVLMMLSLYKALKLESLKTAGAQQALAGLLSGRTSARDGQSNWTLRLSRVASYPTHVQVSQYLENTVKPAFEAVMQALESRHYAITLEQGEGEQQHLGLRIELGTEQDFRYEVWPRQCLMPSFTPMPQEARSHYYRLEVHLREGSLNYDLMGYSREQVIEDVVDHFEAHMEYLHLRRETAPGIPTSDDTLPDARRR